MPREEIDDPLFRRAGKPWDPFSAWCWLIENARYAAGTINVNGQIVALDRGQLCASLRFMARAWCWDDMAVSRFLKRIQKGGKIEARVEAGQTVITICNYVRYQTTQPVCEAASEAPMRQRRGSDEAKYKEGKERKEGNQQDSTCPAGDTRDEAGDDLARLPEPAQAALFPGADVVRLGARDCDRVVALWNAMVAALPPDATVPRVRGYSDERARAVRKTVKAIGIEGVEQVLAKIAASRFLRGAKGKFSAHFDWVFVGSVKAGAAYQQIFEGRFDQDFATTVEQPKPKTDYQLKQEAAARRLERLVGPGVSAADILGPYARAPRDPFSGTTLDGDIADLRDIELKESVS